MGPRGYAICATARSGSNFLSQVLASTDLLGRPLEYFNGRGRRRIDFRGYPDDPYRQCELVLSLGSTPNGVYGLKVLAGQADKIADTRWWTRLAGLAFVHYRRNDLLGQALSRARASQTKQWRSTLPALGEAVYDGPLIEQNVRATLAEHESWRRFFASQEVAPLGIAYEEVVERPQAAVDAVAALMQVEGAVCDLSRVDVTVQRDSNSAAWRERFLSETTSRDIIDQL